MARNASRKVKVMDDVMVSMATKFEPPDPEANYWEVNSLIVDAHTDVDV